MEVTFELFKALLPWLILLMFIVLCPLMIKGAKKRKAVAVMFIGLMHMVLPDPKVQQTIKIVQEAKQESRKQKQDEEGSLGNTGKE